MPVAAHLGALTLVRERQVAAYLFQHHEGKILGTGQHSGGALVSRQAPVCAAFWCWTPGCGSRNTRPLTDRARGLCHFCFVRLVGWPVLGAIPVSYSNVRQLIHAALISRFVLQNQTAWAGAGSRQYQPTLLPDLEAVVTVADLVRGKPRPSGRGGCQTSLDAMPQPGGFNLAALAALAVLALQIHPGEEPLVLCHLSPPVSEHAAAAKSVDARARPSAGTARPG